MDLFNVPDPLDAEDTIADYLSAAKISTTRRKQVIKNSVIPLVLLIKAGQLASAAGPEEKEVFAHFVRSFLIDPEKK